MTIAFQTVFTPSGQSRNLLFKKEVQPWTLHYISRYARQSRHRGGRWQTHEFHPLHYPDVVVVTGPFNSGKSFYQSVLSRWGAKFKMIFIVVQLRDKFRNGKVILDPLTGKALQEPKGKETGIVTIPVLPIRLPKCTWPAIREYMRHPANLANAVLKNNPADQRSCYQLVIDWGA